MRKYRSPFIHASNRHFNEIFHMTLSIQHNLYIVPPSSRETITRRKKKRWFLKLRSFSSVESRVKEWWWSLCVCVCWACQEGQRPEAYKNTDQGTSLVVQWLRNCLPNTRNISWIPGWKTKIPHAPGSTKPSPATRESLHSAVKT